MARMLTLVLLAASVATIAFGGLIEDEDARLNIDFCKDNTNGACGECPGVPKKYELNKCEILESKVAFMNHPVYKASCNKTDNTFTLTRYTDLGCEEGTGVTVTAPIGCLTRHVVGRLTASVKTSISFSGSFSFSVKPVLKLCESDDESCPEDCAVNVIDLEKTDGSCTWVASSGGALSYQLSLEPSSDSVSVSFKLWEGTDCEGDAIGEIEPQSLSLSDIGTSGICVPIATEHWDVTCGLPIGSSPEFVGGSLQLESCTDNTNDTCGGCSSSPKKIKLTDECREDPSTVAFTSYNYYTASCNEDNGTTFTVTRYKDAKCEGRGIRMKAPVGCLTRHVVGRLTAELETGTLGVPTGVKRFLFKMCESKQSDVCPKDCSVNTLELSSVGDVCTPVESADLGDYSYKFTPDVDISSLSVTVGFGLWKNRDCSGDAIGTLTQQKLALASISEDGICLPHLSTQHWNVTCLPPAPLIDIGDLGDLGNNNNSSDSASGVVVVTGVFATLFAALLLQ